MRAIHNTLMGAVVAAALTTAACTADSGSRQVGTTMDDAAITASVKSRLVADEDTKARQINVETSRGIVQLNGFVDTAMARNEAQRIAAGTDGVRKVRNNLEVRPAARSSSEVADDMGLSAKVDAALAGDERTSALSIDVAAREGEVQLSGFVESDSEKRAATDIARKVEGVRIVRNVIDVR
jgi:hyperosmotically inducible protein